MGLFSSDKPYTAISSSIERLTASSGSGEDAADLLELIELIQINTGTGSYEAGRALRKRLKYGTAGQQLRALDIVEMIIDNGGKQMSVILTNSGLDDQILTLARSGELKPKKRTQRLLQSWATRDDTRLSSMMKRAGLGTASASHSRNTSLDHGVASPSAARGRHSRAGSEQGHGSVSRVRSPSRSPSPLNVRGASLTTTIATAHSVATRLAHSIILHEGRISNSRETKGYFRQAKELRRRILTLIHEDSADVQEYLEQLLRTNEELLTALTSFEDAMAGRPFGQVAASVGPEDKWERGQDDEGPSLPQRPSQPASQPSSQPSEPAEDTFGDDNSTNPFADANEVRQPPQHTPIW